MLNVKSLVNLLNLCQGAAHAVAHLERAGHPAEPDHGDGGAAAHLHQPGDLLGLLHDGHPAGARHDLHAGPARRGAAGANLSQPLNCQVP